MDKKKAQLGVFVTILAACLWGFSGACGQYLFQNKGVTVRWLVPVRLMTAGLILLIFHICKEKKEAFRIFREKRNTIDIIIYGIAGLMLCQYTFFATIELSNAGTATIMKYIAPVLIMLIVCAMEKRRPKAIELLALPMAISGIVLIATHGNLHQLAISPAALGMGMFSASAVVIYNLQPRRLLKQFPAPYLMGWAMTIGGIFISIIFKPWQYHYDIDLSFILALTGVIALGTIAGFCLYTLGVTIIGPAKASLFSCVEPISATTFSALWLHAPFTVPDLCGFALIIATMIMISIQDIKRKQVQEQK